MHKDLRHRVGFSPFTSPIVERKSTDTHSADLEKDEKGLPVLARFPMLDLNHYKMVNEVWHFYSVDWGTNCRSLIISYLLNLVDYCRSLYRLQFNFRHRW